jgi:hypothetical protein
LAPDDFDDGDDADSGAKAEQAPNRRKEVHPEKLTRFIHATKTLDRTKKFQLIL